MTDSKYFYRPYNSEFRRAITIYSDKVYTLEELFPETKGVPPRFPDIIGILQEFELSDKYLIQTAYAPNMGESGKTVRTIINGDFAFNGNELVGGKVKSTLSVDSAGKISGKVFSSPIDVTFSNPRDVDWDDEDGISVTSMGEFSKFFPEGWANRPFEDNLISVGKTSSSSGSSSSSKGKTFNGTTKIDKIIGTSKDDIIIGGGAADRLTGGRGKDRFVYNTINDSRPGPKNRDTITDLNGREGDRIDLRRIDGNTKVKGNQKLRFIGSKAFSGKKGEVRFAGGILQVDNNLDRKSDMEIALTGVTSFNQNFLIL